MRNMSLSMAKMRSHGWSVSVSWASLCHGQPPSRGGVWPPFEAHEADQPIGWRVRASQGSQAEGEVVTYGDRW